MTEQKQNVEITIQDLAIIRSIIDAAFFGSSAYMSVNR